MTTIRRVAVPPEDLPSRDTTIKHFSLPQDAAHYVRDVLRMNSGEELELFNGQGRSVMVRLNSISADSVEVELLSDQMTSKGESPVEITLFNAIPKGDRWDWLLEKSTELGVTRIVPLQTSRTVVQIPAAKAASKQQRWQKIVTSAARQSGRTISPEVLHPLTIEQALNTLHASLHIIAHTANTSKSIPQLLTETIHCADLPALSIALWIGPEGGFTSQELAKLQAYGAHVCTLGPRVLRCETAGVVGVALVQSVLGDLK